MSHTVDHLALARGTVTNLVPVAEAALTSRSRDSVVRTIARQLERHHHGVARAHIAAEAIVRLAEQDMPGQGGEDHDRARRHADGDLRGGR